MIEEIAHMIFGPAGAVAAIVMLDSLGGNNKKTKEAVRRPRQLAIAPASETTDKAVNNDSATDKKLDEKTVAEPVLKTAPASLKQRKLTTARETKSNSGRARKKIVSADKKAKSKTAKRAASTTSRTKARTHKKSKKAA